MKLLGSISSPLAAGSLKRASREISRPPSNLIERSTMTTPTPSRLNVKHLTQEEAINLDRELFDEYKFSVDQLMELAGLSVATVIARTYPHHKRPIICCGPGNNGGDGLVCARHLKLFGYSPLVICPKPGRSQLYENLMTQCSKFQIPILSQVPVNKKQFGELGDLVVDAIFGFSFEPPNRSPDFALLLNLIHANGTHMPLVSVDIPSGWHVQSGCAHIDQDQATIEAHLKVPGLKPDCLISLTAPKLCAKTFTGQYHYLAGRFCPDALEAKYQLNLPHYEHQDCIVRLG